MSPRFLSLLALSIVLAACGGVSTPLTGAAPDAASGAASDGASAADAASETDAGSDAGAETDASAGDATVSIDAAPPPSGTLSAACSACVPTCAPEAAACAADPACVAEAQCLAACTTAACLATCATGDTTRDTSAQTLYTCFEAGCPSQCLPPPSGGTCEALYMFCDPQVPGHACCGGLTCPSGPATRCCAPDGTSCADDPNKCCPGSECKNGTCSTITCLPGEGLGCSDSQYPCCDPALHCQAAPNPSNSRCCAGAGGVVSSPGECCSGNYTAGADGGYACE